MTKDELIEKAVKVLDEASAAPTDAADIAIRVAYGYMNAAVLLGKGKQLEVPGGVEETPQVVEDIREQAGFAETPAEAVTVPGAPKR